MYHTHAFGAILPWGAAVASSKVVALQQAMAFLLAQVKQRISFQVARSRVRRRQAQYFPAAVMASVWMVMYSFYAFNLAMGRGRAAVKSADLRVGARRQLTKASSLADQGAVNEEGPARLLQADGSATVEIPLMAFAPIDAVTAMTEGQETVTVAESFLFPLAGATEAGNATATKVAGTTWVLQHWPLKAVQAGEQCSPVDINTNEFRFRATYTLHDKMNDRTTQEPSFRFVHLARPLPNQKAPVEHGRMLAADKDLACLNAQSLRPETLPQGGCPNASTPLTNDVAIGGPWCAPWNAPVFIGELTCGFMQNCQPNGNMAFMVIAASGAAMSHKRMALEFPPPASVPVQEYDTLAVPGYSEYVSEPGHFQNEVLGRLLHLDRFLPPEVPMVWPTGSIPELVLDYLKEEGLIGNRQMVKMDTRHTPAFIRAKRLYFYGTTEPLAMSPVVTWFSQRMLSAAYTSTAPSLTSTSMGSLPEERKGGGLQVLVLRRPGSGSRTMSNENQVMEALDQIVKSKPELFNTTVVRWVAQADNFRATVEAVHRADIIIGPHGANLNNIMFAREGTAVIEIGFLQNSFHLPSDYLCLGRNLGFLYWTVFPKAGGYSDQLTVDVAGLVDAVQEAGKAVLARRQESVSSESY